jgi:hypothetical protein
MHMQEIRGRARTLGLAPGRATKVMLVRRIQAREGNFPCFATAVDRVCDQSACLWREDCFSNAHKTVAA